MRQSIKEIQCRLISGVVLYSTGLPASLGHGESPCVDAGLYANNQLSIETRFFIPIRVLRLN